MRHPAPMLSLLAVGLLSLGATGTALGDSDHDRQSRRSHRPLFPPATNASYNEECSGCHLAYQPGLLTADAWQAIMKPPALADHYGDDATLEDAVRREIAAYLIDNAGNPAKGARPRAYAAAPSDNAAEAGEGLPRLTTTRRFRGQHHEIPARLVTGNPEVVSFSRCDSCHRGAQDGVYNEHDVDIPGAGRWDD